MVYWKIYGKFSAAGLKLNREHRYHEANDLWAYGLGFWRQSVTKVHGYVNDSWVHPDDERFMYECRLANGEVYPADPPPPTDSELIDAMLHDEAVVRAVEYFNRRR
jgi:hypothetical protein